MVYRRIFARGVLAIMAANTICCYPLVIKYPGNKTCGHMAHGTVFRGENMVCRLADSRCVIVAGSTVVHDTGVVEYRREEAAGYVTKTAILRGGQMAGVLADG